MKIPDSIRIGGIEYEVCPVEVSRVGNDICYGSIHYSDSRIELSTSDASGHQIQCVTLWHEILHGIARHACLEIENEEEIVECFSKGIYQVLADNADRLFDVADDVDAP